MVMERCICVNIRVQSVDLHGKNGTHFRKEAKGRKFKEVAAPVPTQAPNSGLTRNMDVLPSDRGRTWQGGIRWPVQRCAAPVPATFERTRSCTSPHVQDPGRQMAISRTRLEQSLAGRRSGYREQLSYTPQPLTSCLHLSLISLQSCGGGGNRFIGDSRNSS